LLLTFSNKYTTIGAGHFAASVLLGSNKIKLKVIYLLPFLVSLNFDIFDAHPIPVNLLYILSIISHFLNHLMIFDFIVYTL